MKERTNLGVLIDRNLWNDFRKRAIDEGVKTGALLERLLRAYLDRPSNGQILKVLEEGEVTDRQPIAEKRPRRKDLDPGDDPSEGRQVKSPKSSRFRGDR